MKIDDIVIKDKDKCLMLGIFSCDTWDVIYGLYRPVTYGMVDRVLGLDWVMNTVIENVEKMCKMMDQIIFILDDIQFPIDPDKSLTCGELQLICENDEFFNKTIFVKGENVIEFDKNLVLN